MHKCFSNVKLTNVRQLVKLSSNETHHLMRVMRHKIGENVFVIDGIGSIGEAKIVSFDDKTAELEILKINCRNNTKASISLIVPLLKNNNTDFIIREATAIGVSEIFPVQTDKCDFKISCEKIEKKHFDWVQDCVEACKQSGNLYIPIVHKIAKFETVVRNFDDDFLKIFGGLSEKSDNLVKILQNNSCYTKILIAIGPEGDFSQSEYSLMRENKFKEAKFSENILRAETAAIYAISVINNIFQTNEIT